MTLLPRIPVFAAEGAPYVSLKTSDLWLRQLKTTRTKQQQQQEQQRQLQALMGGTGAGMQNPGLFTGGATGLTDAGAGLVCGSPFMHAYACHDRWL